MISNTDAKKTDCIEKCLLPAVTPGVWTAKHPVVLTTLEVQESRYALLINISFQESTPLETVMTTVARYHLKLTERNQSRSHPEVWKVYGICPTSMADSDFAFQIFFLLHSALYLILHLNKKLISIFNVSLLLFFEKHTDENLHGQGNTRRYVVRT